MNKLFKLTTIALILLRVEAFAPSHLVSRNGHDSMLKMSTAGEANLGKAIITAAVSLILIAVPTPVLADGEKLNIFSISLILYSSLFRIKNYCISLESSNDPLYYLQNKHRSDERIQASPN